MPQDTRRAAVVIVGAGSAGLAALREVRKRTEDYYLVDSGPLGTTCARVGCMPSKALIAVADDLARTRRFAAIGIDGSEHLACDLPRVLRHVRAERDRYTESMVSTTRSAAGERLIIGQARLDGPQMVCVGDLRIETDAVILATGAKPMVPGAWRAFGERVITSEDIFEREDLPPRLAVIGLGAIGIELGTALSRLGREVTGFEMRDTIAGLSDPEVARAAADTLGAEMPLHLGQAVEIEQGDDALIVRCEAAEVRVDAVIAATGVRPAIADLGLETLGVELDDHGMPPVDPQALRIGDTGVFMAGDANGMLPLLHEAADDGYIAGHNALAERQQDFCRRTPLKLVFSDPQIAVAGRSLAELDRDRIAIGTVDFSDQGRARLMGRNQGRLALYIDRDSRRLRGSEMVAPDAEYLGHLLCQAIDRGLSVDELLLQPFYHPTIVEGLRTALRHAADDLGAISETRSPPICAGSPEAPLT
ncbi:MAG: dihydrolipoyl dehydrogenase [Planctomycetota bacterium]